MLRRREICLLEAEGRRSNRSFWIASDEILEIGRRDSLLHRGPIRGIQLDCRRSVLRIADTDQRSGFLGCFQRLRDREGNGLSPVFDFCGLERLETLDRSPPRERKLDRLQAIEVLVRQDQECTGYAFGAALVDPRDAAPPNTRRN